MMQIVSGGMTHRRVPDGSQMKGHQQIETELKQVFADHKTARYVWKTEEIRLLNPETALLRAIVSMVPPGKNEINPERNAVQSLIQLIIRF